MEDISNSPKGPTRRHIRIQDQHGILLKDNYIKDQPQKTTTKTESPKIKPSLHLKSISSMSEFIKHPIKHSNRSKSASKITVKNLSLDSDPEDIVECSDFELETIKYIQNQLNMANCTQSPSNRIDLSEKNLAKLEYIKLAKLFKNRLFPNVTELALTGNNLQSPLPENIFAGFPNLVRMNLNENHLTEIPPDIASLQSLRYLDLRSNKCTELPDFLYQFNLNLEHLYLRYNKISVISDRLANLTNLTTLIFRQNRISILPESFGELTALIHLDISQNKIKSIPSSLKNCENIEMLDLQHNQISSIPDDVFENMKKLYKLGLKYNKLETLPSSLVHTLVDHINIEGNLVQEIPEGMISGLNLMSLNMNRNVCTRLPVQDGPFQWPMIANFSIDYNELESIDIGIFANSPNLHTLSFKNNCLTCLPFDMGTWGRMSLTELFLPGNKLSYLPENIGLLTELEVLNLAQNTLTRLPGTLGKLKNLMELDLEENNLDALPNEIGHLSNLQKLTVNYNELLTLPYTIGTLRELTHLKLCENKIHAIPKEIGKLNNLKELHLSRNLNLNILPLALAECPQLQFLAIEKCPLNSFPREYVLGGPACIIQYMRAKNNR